MFLEPQIHPVKHNAFRFHLSYYYAAYMNDHDATYYPIYNVLSSQINTATHTVQSSWQPRKPPWITLV